MVRASHRFIKVAAQTWARINSRALSHRVESAATSSATRAFLLREDVDLPLHHSFHGAGLYINPIIHGPPLTPLPTRKEELYMLQALSKHKSNALFVYDHYTGTYGSALSDDQSWAASSLAKIFELANVERSEVVTFAGLGKLHAEMQLDVELKGRLEEAMERTGLTQIDYAVLEFDSDSFTSGTGTTLDDAVSAMEQLCGVGGLVQGYGLHIAVPPYIYQCPVSAKSGNLAIVPSMVESAVGLQHYDQDGSGDQRGTRNFHAEMMIYSCSPSTAIPATYPMLEPNPEVWDNRLVEPGIDDDLVGMGLAGDALIEAEDLQLRVRALGEEGRRFSRVALDPLLCYRGVGVQGSEAGATPSAGGAEEEEHDAGDLGILVEEWERHLDGLDASERGSAVGGKHTGRTTGVGNSESESRMTTRKFLNGDPVRLLTSPYVDLDKMARTEGGRQRAIAMTERDSMIAEALDELAPRLADGHSPSLQDKALRAVLSVGFDAVVLDAESSAHCGKLSLGPAAMLSSTDTEGLFGSFEVPEGFHV